MGSLGSAIGVSSGERGWYSPFVMFADWRHVGPVDMSTNPTVSRFYSGEPTIAFRTRNRPAILEALAAGDTLRVGLDYYVLTGQCNDLLPASLLPKYEREWQRGGVVIIEMFRARGGIVFSLPDGESIGPARLP